PTERLLSRLHPCLPTRGSERPAGSSALARDCASDIMPASSCGESVHRPMRIDFTKMHGLGNDFIVFDAPAGGPPPTAALRRLAERRSGIGFDQALVLEPPRHAGSSLSYRIFNADGSEVEQC